MSVALGLTVLMTADTVGGVWTYATALAGALAQRNIEVHLVTMGPPARPDQRAMIADNRVTVIDSGLELEWRDPAGDDVPRARAVLSRIAQDICPDIVHLNSFREASYDWDAPCWRPRIPASIPGRARAMTATGYSSRVGATTRRRSARD